MCPRIVDKELKKEKILRAAVKVFARQGANDFKMIDIALEAGIGKGTLYEYFKSKDEVITNAYQLFLRDYELFFTERLKAISEPSEKLENFVNSSFDFFDGRRDLVKVMFDFWSMGVVRHDGCFFIKDFDETYREIVGFIKSIIDEGIDSQVFKPVDSEITASLLLAMIDGIMFQVVLGLIKLDGVMLSRTISEMVLKGLYYDNKGC